MDDKEKDKADKAMDQLPPLVIVLSQGKETTDNIINNIRKIPLTDNTQQLDNCDLIGYKYHITTKYYETDILFVPYDKTLNTFPLHLRIFVEGLFVYFDANDRSFLTSINDYAEYLDSTGIEIGILLCDELVDDEKDGCTYKEIKQASKLLDVIELERKKDNDDDDDVEEEENSEHHDPVGYDEVQQVLRSFLWSNVQSGSRIVTGNYNHGFDYTGESMSEAAIETELADFEHLLTDMMAFKNNASTWSRSDRLAYTQTFADAFDSLIGDDIDDDDDENGGIEESLDEAVAATPD